MTVVVHFTAGSLYFIIITYISSNKYSILFLSPNQPTTLCKPIKVYVRLYSHRRLKHTAIFHSGIFIAGKHHVMKWWGGREAKQFPGAVIEVLFRLRVL
jgi:hypothetical protein